MRTLKQCSTKKKKTIITSLKKLKYRLDLCSRIHNVPFLLCTIISFFLLWLTFSTVKENLSTNIIYKAIIPHYKQYLQKVSRYYLNFPLHRKENTTKKSYYHSEVKRTSWKIEVFKFFLEVITSRKCNWISTEDASYLKCPLCWTYCTIFFLLFLIYCMLLINLVK